MDVASILELLMMVTFGVSWPINIRKMWKVKTAKSTTVVFYYLIWLGYVFGIIGKIILIIMNAPTPWYETVKWYVMFIYILNTLMVSIGIGIYYRNRAIDRKNG